jgi:hypothetical protein
MGSRHISFVILSVSIENQKSGTRYTHLCLTHFLNRPNYEFLIFQKTKRKNKQYIPIIIIFNNIF